MTPETPFVEQLAFKPQGTNKNEFETIHPPQKMGNPANIAYGGYALATACKAAALSVPSNYHLYSFVGNYLGPAYADRPLRATVRTIRQTRTFATRQVEVSQKQDNGDLRVCLIALADFQTKEKASFMTYSKPPTKQYPNWKDCPTQQESHQKLLGEGKISQKLLALHAKMFSLLPSMYEQRQCPEGIFAQNLNGMAKTLDTTQDHLPLTRKSTADWFKCKQPLPTAVDHISNLTFLIDGAIAFVPLSFSKQWFDDIGACSSLDFALRIFQNGKENDTDDGLDLHKWHLREMTTSAGSEGRTYSESWVWDEQGRAIACMSQQSIMRPPPGGKGKL